MPAVGRDLDQTGQPFRPGFVAFGVHDPVDRGLPVGRRLLAEELPRLLSGPELRLAFGVERRKVAVLVRVHARACVLTAPERRQSGGRHQPRAVSSSTFLMLTALQLLFGFRGVNRWTRLVSSSRCATLSIQPKQRAWSTASDHVMLGLPEPFL